MNQKAQHREETSAPEEERQSGKYAEQNSDAVVSECRHSMIEVKQGGKKRRTQGRTGACWTGSK